MKPYRLILLTAALVLVLVGSGYADQSQTKDLTVTATVVSKCELTLAPTTINFPDTDPDEGGGMSIPGSSTVAVTAKVKTASGANNVTLKCLSDGDLISLTNADDIIPIANVSWTAANVLGTGFVATGTMAKTPAAAVSVGTWTGSGKYTGTLTYALVNSWSYAVGSYSAKVTYTLACP